MWHIVVVAVVVNAVLAASVVVTPPAGALRGSTDAKADRFLGVPFAQPPVGNLRWRSPQTFPKWSGIRNATAFAPDCITNSNGYVKGVKSEDCLYLNVYRPAGVRDADKLPVMVWIYGGSFEHGGSSYQLYESSQLAAAGRVIVVTLNYRLGVMGYLGAHALKADAPDGSTGNYGMQDQRAAMQWVQENIAAFGGDPDNVLLLGQSAGGSSTAAHVASPRSAGLFHRALIESGSPADWGQFDLVTSDALARQMGGLVDCTQTDDSAWVACMRATNGSLLASFNDVVSFNGTVGWASVIDGVEFSDNFQHLWQAGKINKLKGILLGTVQDEGTEFIPFPFNATAAQYEVFINASFINSKRRADVRALYPVDDFATPFVAAEQVSTHMGMACPAQRAATWALTKAGVPVYVYFWAHRYSIFKKSHPDWLIGHSSEVPFVFHHAYALLGPGELELSTQVVAYWTNFAATGDPNTPGENNPSAPPVSAQWPLFDAINTTHLVLNLTSYPSTNYVSSTYCDYWEEVYMSGCRINTDPVYC